MMQSYEIIFDARHEGMDLRPPGARELIDALYNAARGNPLAPGDAADAHNYICNLENQVSVLHYKLHHVLHTHTKIETMNQALLELLADLQTMPPFAPPVKL